MVEKIQFSQSSVVDSKHLLSGLKDTYGVYQLHKKRANQLRVQRQQKNCEVLLLLLDLVHLAKSNQLQQSQKLGQYKMSSSPLPPRKKVLCSKVFTKSEGIEVVFFLMSIGISKNSESCITFSFIQNLTIHFSVHEINLNTFRTKLNCTHEHHFCDVFLHNYLSQVKSVWQMVPLC